MIKTATKKRLLQLAGRLKSGRVLVVGDVMLDQFIYGTVGRISPEAPVPVVKVERDVFRLGGGANVASNLTAFGAQAVLCGLIGQDTGGEELCNICEEQGIGADGLVYTRKRSTTIKTRIIAHHQQVVRFDREQTETLNKRLVDRLIQRVEEFIPDINSVIISDYGKGVITKGLLDYLRKAKRKHKLVVAVDPKVGNYSHYKNATFMTPNHHEAGQMLGKKINNDDQSIAKAGKTLMRRLSLDSIVITRGEGGMTVVTDKSGPLHIPTRARQVFDVTGAGDTVIATLTLALSVGASLFEAAEIANYAAGVVVGKLGTDTTNVSELKKAIQRGYP